MEENKREKIPEILRKPGKFYITKQLLEDNPKAVMKVMSHMIVTRCEYLFDTQSCRFEYIALSDLFDKINLGEMIPEYTIEIDSNTGRISARKIETGVLNATFH